MLLCPGRVDLQAQRLTPPTGVLGAHPQRGSLPALKPRHHPLREVAVQEREGVVKRGNGLSVGRVVVRLVISYIFWGELRLVCMYYDFFYIFTLCLCLLSFFFLFKYNSLTSLTSTP